LQKDRQVSLDCTTLYAKVVMEHDLDSPQDAGQLEGRYANYVQVGHNAFEFVLDFGQFYQDSQEARFHTRIVTGPVYALAFLATLRASIDQYEYAHGTIPTGET
jgi:hypothetical protein